MHCGLKIFNLCCFHKTSLSRLWFFFDQNSKICWLSNNFLFVFRSFNNGRHNYNKQNMLLQTSILLSKQRGLDYKKTPFSLAWRNNTTSGENFFSIYFRINNQFQGRNFIWMRRAYSYGWLANNRLILREIKDSVAIFEQQMHWFSSSSVQ